MEEDIKRRHRSVVRELNGHKEKHLKMKAHRTSLTGKLEEKTPGRRPRGEDPGAGTERTGTRSNQTGARFGYSLERSMYQYLSYYYRGYYDLLIMSHFQ